MGILWFINSSPEFYFEQQMPLDSKQVGVAFRPEIWELLS
jgi:hypothetical protein